MTSTTRTPILVLFCLTSYRQHVNNYISDGCLIPRAGPFHWGTKRKLQNFAGGHMWQIWVPLAVANLIITTKMAFLCVTRT
jgi:hypothetical protein